MSESALHNQAVNGLPADTKKFLEELREKVKAGRKRCPVCKQKQDFMKLPLVDMEPGIKMSQLGIADLVPLWNAAVLPFVEFCTKCGHADINPKILEQQVLGLQDKFTQLKTRIELQGGVQAFVQSLMAKQRQKSREEGEGSPVEKRPSGLIVTKS